MKKLLALLLALSCAVSLAACKKSKVDGGKPAPEKTDEQLATEAAEGFLDALVDLDYDGMAEYVDDASVIPEEFKDFNADELTKTMTEGQGPEFEPFTEDLKGLSEDIIGVIKDNMSYKITSTEKDGDNYIITAEMSICDFDSVNFDSIVEENFKEEDLNKMLMELLASGKISADSSQEEILAIIMPDMIKAMRDGVKNMDVTSTTEEYKLTVSEIDGEWLVNSDLSDID